MIKKIVSISSILSIFAWTVPVLAKPAVYLPPPGENREVRYLGKHLDPQTHELVEGYAIVHYKKNEARSNAAKPPKTQQCYSFIASGAKWKSVEPWMVNPSNSRGLDSNFVLSGLASDIAKWEDGTDGVLGNGGTDILGNGFIPTGPSSTLSMETTSPDGTNEVYFADVAEQGVIAVTNIWGIFSGPTFNRKLVEWDQVYDDVDYDWSSSGEPGKMDFENIATHEIGHAVGMDHPSSLCADETMYAYADYGETKKRDLNTGDITGINLLY